MNILTTQSYSPEGQAFTDVLMEVLKLYGRFLAEGDKLVQPFGLTTARWKVLCIVSLASQPLTVPQIGRRIGLSRQNIQRLVDALEEEGWLEHRDNPDHKRAKLVVLTEKGTQQHETIMHEHIPWANQCADGLSREDLDGTLCVLRKLTTQLSRT